MPKMTRALGGLVALVLLAAACGDDEDEIDAAATEATEAVGDAVSEATEEDESEDETEDESESEGDESESEGSGPATSGESVDLDTNGDGEVVFGVATPGPRDDGAYYQALVEGVTAFSEEQGYAEPIIVDNIESAQAETELRNLARQGVDVLAVGAGEIADPLEALTEEFAETFWYCNCGAGYPQVPGLAQSNDDSSEISYSAGFATGLLLQEDGTDSVAFLGCCELDFEQEALQAFELGLQAVDEAFTITYVPTGDFNDVAGATEAFNQAAADGVGAVYPFLGGSHEAVVQLANENDVRVMSAGASDACGRDDLAYDIAVRFDAGDYLDTIFARIIDGTFKEGDAFTFHVGEFDFVGAELCDATPEQVEALEEVKASIAAGDFEEEFGAIKGEVYGG